MAQRLGQIMGRGRETIPRREVLEREGWERLRDPLGIVARVPLPTLEPEDTTPPDDSELIHCLVGYGLRLAVAEMLYQHGCEHISDVRSAAMSDTEIPGYEQSGLVTLEEVRRCLVRVDLAREDERTRHA